MDKSIQEIETSEGAYGPGVDYVAELVQHRAILQGMAVHLEQLQGELYEVRQAVSELVSYLTPSMEETSEAGAEVKSD